MHATQNNYIVQYIDLHPSIKWFQQIYCPTYVSTNKYATGNIPIFYGNRQSHKKYFIFGAQKMTVENYLIFSDK
jgi:hypothetical protein